MRYLLLAPFLFACAVQEPAPAPTPNPNGFTINLDGSLLLSKERAQILEDNIKADNVMITELQKEVWKLKAILKAPKECL